MFSKKQTPSLISADVTIEGEIKSTGMIQFDGTITGQISVNHLTVGECGTINGSIKADEIIIKGKVTGSVHANKVVLEKSAKVEGDIFHQTISIATGASVAGTIKQLSEAENVTDIAASKHPKTAKTAS